MIATLIKKLEGFTGRASLYKLDPPVQTEGGGTEFVVVSATTAFGQNETYIFASDAEGKISDWGELDGSYRGGQDHERALRGLGYEIK